MHNYIDILHTNESKYDVKPMSPLSLPSIHLQEHHKNIINQFLALSKVIHAWKRKQQQPLLDFTKSKIRTSTPYTQGCDEVLA